MAINAAASKNISDTDSPKIRIEMTAPRKGAVEKYAPVRALPSPRRARTNNTKLTPYPRNPSIMIGPNVAKAGSCDPMANAKQQLATPATKPLLPAIKSASEAETLRVRLLSMAQQRQAKATASGPVQS